MAAMKRKITAKSLRQVQTKDDKKKPQDSLPMANLPKGSLMDNVQTVGTPVQTKLTIGQVGDKYEQEADAVAHDVVKQINSPVQRQEEKETPVQRKSESAFSSLKAEIESTGQQTETMFDSAIQRQTQLAEQESAIPEFETALNKTLGKGQSLDEKTQDQMGNAIGADFSGVTIHQDAKADVLCDSIGARAFTTGSDVYFKQGEYQPNSTQGQELLAHELTHVVQQGQGQVQMMVQRQTAKPVLESYASSEGVTWSELIEFSKTDFSYESLDFLTQCETYDKAPSVGMMSLIYNNYVKVGSRKEINVASRNRKNVGQAVETELAKPREQRQAIPGVFDACQDEILFLAKQIVQRLTSKKLFPEN